MVNSSLRVSVEVRASVYEVVSLLFELNIDNCHVLITRLIFPLVIPKPALYFLFASQPVILKVLVLLPLVERNQSSFLNLYIVLVLLPNLKLLANVFKTSISCQAKLVPDPILALLLVHYSNLENVLFECLRVCMLRQKTHNLSRSNSLSKSLF